jgi:integrase
VIVRCHGQIRAMFNWAVRKRMVDANPARAADPPRVKSRQLDVPSMTDVRAVQDVATPEFATFIQLAATVGARRGTLVALRWGDVDLERAMITFSRSIAEAEYGTVEKGTKSDRSYSVTLGPDTKEMLSPSMPVAQASAPQRSESRSDKAPSSSLTTSRRTLEPGLALARLAALQRPGRRRPHAAP